MIRTDFLNLPMPTRQKDREASRKSEAAKGLFGGPASSHGRVVNFSAGGPAPEKARNTTGGVMDLYDSGFGNELARRDEEHDRFAKLPKAIQQAAKAQGVTDLTLLEIAGTIHRKSEVYSGERVQVFASDLAKATGTTTQRAEQLIDEAVRRGLIERTGQTPGGGFFRSRL